MKTVFTLLTAVVLLMNNAMGQTNTFPSTGAAGIGTTTPSASSLLEMNDEKDSDITSLKSEIGELKSEMEELKAMIVSNQSAVNNQQLTVISAASLQQNIPNPFNHTTTINYILPQQYSSAKIIITDKSGKVLKEVNVTGAGKGNFKLDASTLASGAYQYTLYVDGKLIDTKQMILNR